MTQTTMQRVKLVVQGQVQGVGFRPFVFVQAEQHNLTGFVHNTPLGVVIEAQGLPACVHDFCYALQHRLPPLALITQFTQEDIAPLPCEQAFVIIASQIGATHNVLIGADAAICNDCKHDMADENNRRYQYPFTNCTNCGPRYSIVKRIPYDRTTTSMACFPMCPACMEEYTNPKNRRFHAQPNACPVCGPVVWYVPTPYEAEANARATECPSAVQSLPQQGIAQHLAQAAKVVAQGGIIAMKGLGGFHLVCDATNEAAVALLRNRKQRAHKPFAVMVPTIEQARAVAVVSQHQEKLLASVASPIVVCPTGDGAANSGIAPSVSPNITTLGLMLPYTPLHLAFFTAYQQLRAQGATLALVMTSGNLSGEPICLGNREAINALSGFVDGFLLHNRDIVVRVDDSVVASVKNTASITLNTADRGGAVTERQGAGADNTFAQQHTQPETQQLVRVPTPNILFYRRARGYLPAPTALPAWKDIVQGQEDLAEALCSSSNAQQAFSAPLNGADAPYCTFTVGTDAPCVLGVGADMKNTLCLSKGDNAFVSQHIGNMSSVAAMHFHQEVQEHLESVLQVTPSLVVHDAHPQFISTQLALQVAEAKDLYVLPLQHHYAHGYAILAEHNHTKPALVLALDGTGYGEDGTLWGGELLYIHPLALAHKRVGFCFPMFLVGGEQAIKEPWRIAHALMLQLGLYHAMQPLEQESLFGWFKQFAQGAALLPTLLEKKINCPISTSAGRLFDAVSAMLGVCLSTTYEGQAAIYLEQAQKLTPQEMHSGNIIGERDVATVLTILGHSQLQDLCPVLVPQQQGCPLQLNTHALFAHLVTLRKAQVNTALIARVFHMAFAEGVVALAAHGAQQMQVATVGLSGGCMQNITLATCIAKGLKQRGLTVLQHIGLPPNDGCIAYGQVSYGRHWLAVNKDKYSRV